MWMDERVGSTWEIDLLNSHPEIVAIGEALQASSWHESCSFYKGHASKGYSGDSKKTGKIRARGYKVKMFGCLPARHTTELELIALNRSGSVVPPCVGPHSRYADLYKLWKNVGARVVCAVRQNAVERALSIMIKDSFAKTMPKNCRMANYKEGSQCLSHLSRVSLKLDVHRAFELASYSHHQYELALTLCSSTLPALVVEYDDVLRDPTRALNPVLEFLGVPRANLSSNVVKIAETGVHVTNAEQLAAAFKSTRLEAFARRADLLRPFFHDDYTPSSQQPTVAPTPCTYATLADSLSWHKRGSSSFTCEWVQRMLPKRCAVKGEDASLAFDACLCACAPYEAERFNLTHHDHPHPSIATDP